MRRGEVWRYEPVITRPSHSTTRLVISSDAMLGTDLPTALVLQVVETDPGSLLAVRIGEHGWAVATTIDRPPRKRLVERLGSATSDEMDGIGNALRWVLDL
jgi:mRNA-degrading endonuclease toxin of MazEF toxin-antitoxin module